MKKAVYLLLFAIGTMYASAQDKPILVNAQWLHEHQSDPGVVIVQPNFLKLDYEQEHIAGARFLWPGWLAPDSPEGNMSVPDIQNATEVMRKLGISNNSHVIICHVRNEVSPAARMFLMMEYLGMKGSVSFLNGGLEAWKKEGYPVTKDVPLITPGKFKANPQPLVVDKNYVLQKIGSDNTTIVDARPTRFYDGDPTGYPRDGHIKSAKNIPFTELLDASNQFKSTDELKSYFAVIPQQTKEVVTYCFIGQTASVVYMTGRLLGYDMKLYDGSMQEWSRIPDLPMEKTEKENKD